MKDSRALSIVQLCDTELLIDFKALRMSVACSLVNLTHSSKVGNFLLERTKTGPRYLYTRQLVDLIYLLLLPTLEGLSCLKVSIPKEYTLRASVHRREDSEIDKPHSQSPESGVLIPWPNQYSRRTRASRLEVAISRDNLPNHQRSRLSTVSLKITSDRVRSVHYHRPPEIPPCEDKTTVSRVANARSLKQSLRSSNHPDDSSKSARL